MKHNFLKTNLQFFADAGVGEPGAETTTNTSDIDNNSTNAEQSIPSFDEFLKDPKNQSEFDKRIAKALETARGKWKVDAERQIADAKTEAAKLAKMNAEEKAKYEQEKRLADLDKREQEITTRELKAEALINLGEKGLPKELADVLNYKDADSCKASIESVATAFKSAVEKAVNDKLRGTEIPKSNSSSNAPVFGFHFQGVRPKK